MPGGLAEPVRHALEPCDADARHAPDALGRVLFGWKLERVASSIQQSDRCLTGTSVEIGHATRRLLLWPRRTGSITLQLLPAFSAAVHTRHLPRKSRVANPAPKDSLAQPQSTRLPPRLITTPRHCPVQLSLNPFSGPRRTLNALRVS